MGSQLTATMVSARLDGVLGVWYSKAPGVDRSVDALRHASWAGASRHGGAVALVGDDPGAKSSTLPSASEQILADLAMPVLFPRNLADVVDLGRHAVALSRWSGAWVACKLVTSVADAEGTVMVGEQAPVILPGGWEPPPVSGDSSPRPPWAGSQTSSSAAWRAAARYGDADGLNRLTVDPATAAVTLVAAGTVFSDLTEALPLLGLEDRELAALGIRLAEVRMPYPLGPRFLESLGAGVDELIVIEERRELAEHQILSFLGRRRAARRSSGGSTSTARRSSPATGPSVPPPWPACSSPAWPPASATPCGRLPAGVEVQPRAAILGVQEELADVDGVTVVIHDQACPTELRRARKRGQTPAPKHAVVINERVCEGCGDCQVKSNCLSLQTVPTPFGPKTRIDSGTCNVDLACLTADCPAFTLVEMDDSASSTTANVRVLGMPTPSRFPGTVTVRIAGIGGTGVVTTAHLLAWSAMLEGLEVWGLDQTGVVTTAHLLAWSAMLEGLEVWGLDQTGLSQKAGAVVSDLRIGPDATSRSNIPGDGEIDLLLAADLMATARPSVLQATSPERTAVVGSTAPVLSGPMVCPRHPRPGRPHRRPPRHGGHVLPARRSLRRCRGPGPPGGRHRRGRQRRPPRRRVPAGATPRQPGAWRPPSVTTASPSRPSRRLPRRPRLGRRPPFRR